MLWELLKMEIRSITISYNKGKRKQINKCELEIKKILNDLDDKICNSDDLQAYKRSFGTNEKRPKHWNFVV